MTLQQQLAALMEELGTEYISISIGSAVSTLHIGESNTVLFGPAYDKTLEQAIAEIKGGAA